MYKIDKDLIGKCTTGDRRSQRDFYDRYAPQMFAICKKYFNSQPDAEDALQDGFVRVFNNLDKFRDDGSFDGWMKKIFIRTCIEYFRRKKLPDIVEEVGEEIFTRNENALDKLYEKDVMKTSMKLSEGYRNVFHLYAVKGYSHKDIAQLMNITESTSKSQLTRARRKLREFVSLN